MHGLTTSTNNPVVFAKEIRFSEDMMYVYLLDGREMGIPLTWYPLLQDATAEQRNNYRFIGKGVGIHWPQLDEDILVSRLVNP